MNRPGDAADDNLDAVAEALAHRFRRAAACRVDRLRPASSYGARPRETYDLYAPGSRTARVVNFVGGGSRRRFARGDLSYRAASPLARGSNVAIPGCPPALATITRAVKAAVERVAATVGKPIFRAGHAAVGHLSARQARRGVMPEPVAARLVRVVALSGVRDLRPLVPIEANADLGLDRDEVAASRLAPSDPVEYLRLFVRLGGSRLPGLRPEAALLAKVWTGPGAKASQTQTPDRRHFDVIDPLADPGSSLVADLLD